MAQRKETVRFQAVGNLDKELNKIAKATEKASEAMDEMGKATKESAEKVTASVDKTKKAVEGLATKFLTLELAKQVLEKTVQFLTEATKKYKDAEIAAGGSLNEIAKKSADLTREMDNLTLSIGKFSTRIQESALGDKSDETVSHLSNLIDKTSDYTDDMISMTDATISAVAGLIPFGNQLGLLAGLMPAGIKLLDDWTGSTNSLLESTKALTKEFKESLDPLSSMYGLYDAGYKAYSKANHFQFNSKSGVSSTAKPLDKKPKGKGRKTDSLDDLVNIKPKGEEARGMADELARDSAKRDAEKAELEFLEQRAKLLLEGKEFQAEMLEIEHEMLEPNEKLLRIHEAETASRERASDAAAKRKQEDDQREAEEKGKLEEAEAKRNAAVRAGGDAAVTVAGIVGASERELAAMKGAIETAESIASFASLDIAGGIGHAAAAASFFAVAGSTGGGGGASKKAASSSKAAPRTGQNAREAKESANTSAAPANTVYNVSINSVSKLSAKEARVVAEALNLNARSRV
jgi:hypothetical protein